MISGKNGKILNLHYNEKKRTAEITPDRFKDRNVWYEKGRKILSDITDNSKIKSSWYLIYSGQDSATDISKRIYYLFELENGDTYKLGFLHSDGTLQTLASGVSCLENQEEYQADWEFRADRMGVTYEIKKIE